MNKIDLATLDPTQKRALLAKQLKARAESGGPTHAPLSLSQQRLWFIDQMQPGQSVYTITAALQLQGELDVQRLNSALDKIRERHATLRTRFVDQDGSPVQVIDPATPLDISRSDLTANPDRLNDAVATFTAQPFDLAKGPLLRCLLVRLSPDRHVLAFAAHHIIADYQSLQIMIRELVTFYSDKGANLPPLPLQYADYALAQRRRVNEMQRQADYWHNTLSGLPPLLDMPTDFPRPAHQSFKGARHRFAFSTDLSQRIEALARLRGITPFMVLLAGFHILHQRYSGTTDICIGTTVSNRDKAELQGLVGYFVNTLALRCEVRQQDSFDHVLSRLRDSVTGAMTHQDVPFEQIMEIAGAQRSLAHSSIFQSMLNLHEKQPDRIEMDGVEITSLPLTGHNARFDLCLDLFRGEAITGVLEYSTALFAPDTIARMARDYTSILDAATADPTRELASISLVEGADRDALDRFNDTAHDVPDAVLARLIASTAKAHADQTALIVGDQLLTYVELDAAANRLAAHLAPSVPKGARIAICLPRTSDLMIALLAALKLGAAYVPLDPNHPPKRLQMILEDAAPALMITAGDPPVTPSCPIIDLNALRDQIAACSADPLARKITGDDLAYVIFTSGTTGRPKGVPIRQQSLVNLLTSMAAAPGMAAHDTLVAVTTPAFDIAALELFLPLLTGGTLVLADSYDVIDGHALSHLITKTGATMMQATPATWRLLIEEGWTAPTGFRILSGGEALDPALASDLLATGGTLWNLYGPTETTIWSACYNVSAEDCARRLIPLGAPIANTSLHVLDAGGQICPAGVAGELHIGGMGLSPGYLDRPDLTAERFVTVAGERLYRAGDRVKRLANGTLVYLGRLDFQVKLRGFRIELGEIEAQLGADPAVEQAVVTLHGEGDDAALIAYCRPSAGQQVIEARLRQRLTETVPGYMMPAAFVVLDSFPLNANGKVDRGRLPAPAAQSGSTSEPQTPTEAIIARLWQELLNIPAPDRNAEFFALGGHSLLAMRMIARLPQEGTRAVPLRLLFENPRLSDFAAALDDAGLIRDDVIAPIPRLPEGAERPLSFAQMRQWTLATLDPGEAAYNLPAALRLSGPVDTERLGRAWSLLCQRHEILRSAYPDEGGKPRVVIHPAPSGVLDCPQITEADLIETLQTEAARPFDLAQSPLARLKFYRNGNGDHLLLLVLHHIIADAISLQKLLRELVTIYVTLVDDPDHQPPALPVQYADYAAWQLRQDTSRHISYWVDHLRGAPPLLELPTDFLRPARQGFAGGSVDFAISGKLARGLRDLAARNSATPYMTLMAAYAALLGRYTGSDEVVIGTPVTHRPHPDLEDLAGMFVNTLPLRLSTQDTGGFTSLLASCREQIIAGLEHQDAPFERVVEELEPDRSWSHNPVFQTIFTWKTGEAEAKYLADAPDWQALSIDSTSSKMDISMGVLDQGDDFALRIEYRRDLFRPETAANMARAFETLIAAVVDMPDMATDELSMLHPEQEAQIAEWNCTDTLPTDGPRVLHDCFTACVAVVGDQIALRDVSDTITYAALDQRSDVLAAHLQTLGIGRGHRVGIALPRRIDLVTAVLAVLKTGAAYVPLDPRYPAERIAYITQDAELSILLSDTQSPGNVLSLSDFWDGAPGVGDTQGGESPRPTRVASQADDLAYLIYTSGSTGNPKGVAIGHENAVALIRWAETVFSEDELAGMLGSTSICFDLSVFEIFVTLSLGGTLLLVEDLFDLPDAPFADQVTFINTVPTPMAELLRLGPLPASVQTICLAGEVLPPSLAASIHAEPGVRLWNLYGPSEDTTYSTGMIVPRDQGFNIGHPILGTQAYVLDGHGQPVPPGMPGELYLAGPGVTQGYWNRADLTAKHFLPDPFAGHGKMYRSGDRVRYAFDGSLDYLGRNDRQVKVRGFRIEPGEIESALTLIPGVTGAAVGVWRDEGQNARLTAWVEGQANPADLSAQLSQSLPAHMVPTGFVVMDALPRLPNGKLDRKALPQPDSTDAKPVPEAAELLPGLETQLAEIWQRVLGREITNRQDNFFSIGGDSILAIQVVALAREAGIALSPRDLFQYSSLASLAEEAQGRVGIGDSQGPITGPQALTPAQQWLLERELPQAHHWNQAMVLEPAQPLDPAFLRRALGLLSDWHDALRARFHRDDHGWMQDYAEPGSDALLTEAASADVTAIASALQAGFDLGKGPLWGAALITLPDGGQRLAIAAHHLLVDGISWRILLGDLQRIYGALQSRKELEAPRRATSPGAWAEFIADSPLLAAEQGYWSDVANKTAPPLSLAGSGADTEGNAARLDSHIDADLTRQVLHDAPASYPVTTPELLVAALYLAMRDWTGSQELALEMESHGRTDLSPAIDLSRTVGWLTAIYPVHLSSDDTSPEKLLGMVKETLRRVPNDGVGYGALRLNEALPEAQPAQVRFNYLGQTAGFLDQASLLRPAIESAGVSHGPLNPRDVPIELNILATDDGLRLGWNYASQQIHADIMARLAENFNRHLTDLVRHCLTGDSAGFTPADFPDMDLGMDDLEDLLRSL